MEEKQRTEQVWQGEETEAWRGQLRHYTYDQIAVGLSHEFTVALTEEYQQLFRKITGDINPLHCDPDFAREKGFGGPVAYGMLEASFYSSLAGVFLPGENSLIHSVEVLFKKPAYIGDVLTVRGTVAEKNDTFRFIKLKCDITRNGKEKCSRAVMQIGVLE